MYAHCITKKCLFSAFLSKPKFCAPNTFLLSIKNLKVLKWNDKRFNALFCFKIPFKRPLSLLYWLTMQQCISMRNCVDTRWYPLIYPLNRLVDALSCSSTHYRKRVLVGCSEFALNKQCISPAFQRVSKANMTSTKTRAVVYLSYGLVHVMKLSHMLNVHPLSCILSLPKS